ncbi:MAG: tetratricopeptide repeat protein, partial [Myxococcales bacterium]|nr:tetratricopeptide repeat protein [Myxococcales bacterium]
ETVVREALVVLEDAVPETVLVAEALDAAGSLARRLGDPARAVVLHRRALELWTARLGPTAGPTGGCRYSLAQALHRTGDFLEALAAMQEAFLVTARTLGNDHLDTWITRFELGRMEVDVGELLDGFPRMEAARAEVARRLGDRHPVVRAMDRFL